MSTHRKQHITSTARLSNSSRGRNQEQLTSYPPTSLKPQPRVTNRPRALRGAIETARDEKLRELAAFLEKLRDKWGQRQPNTEQIHQAGEKMLQLLYEWNALISVLCADRGPLTTESALRVIQVLRNENCPRDWVDGVVRRVGRRIGRGRPRTLQPIGLKALELHRSDPARWTWPSLRSLCNCGKVEHDFLCQKKVQREALLLEARLKSLGVRLPWIVSSPPEKIA